MPSKFVILFSVLLLEYVVCDSRLCGANSTVFTPSCSTQILGTNHSVEGPCLLHIFPPDSLDCKNLVFSPIETNMKVGGVSLKPYSIKYTTGDIFKYSNNYTVLNITFNNIKWKSMKFRFQRYKDGILKNHCRSITIANDFSVNDNSILYYDCYWANILNNASGHSYIFDFEATGAKGINRGQFYFNVPSPAMLSQTLSDDKWKPFTYIEIQVGAMKLHIQPPPATSKIHSFRIEVMRECDTGTQCDEIVQTSMVKLKNVTQEVVYEYSLVGIPGSYYFVVIPLHDQCIRGEVPCQTVESARITTSTKVHTLNICIATLSALIVSALFAYYVVLTFIRKYWCKDYSRASTKDPTPPKILVIYSPTNKLHTECVNSFVSYLRSEYGFHVMYEGDISSTSHEDPYIWALEAYKIASHVMYIVGPVKEPNAYNNIYEQPIITATRDVDLLLLDMLKANRVAKHPKYVMNVLFEHSNGTIPIETAQEKAFHLLNDWQKLISYLSQNLLPKEQLLRTEKGMSLWQDLERAKKIIKADDVVIKCEVLKSGAFEKKVLL